MKTFSVFAAWQAGWNSFMKRPWYLLGITLVTILLFIVALGNAVITALAYILYGGYLTLLINHTQDKHVVFDDLFTVIDFRFVSFAFLALIKGVLVLLGFICFIIPGIYLSVRWMYAELLVIDQGMRPLEALKASSIMTEGMRGKLFLFALLVGITIMLGLLAFIVGAFAMITVSLLALIILYEQAKARLNPPAEIPSVAGTEGM